MPAPIILKISVDMIDKARLFKGEHHTYLDCVAWPVEGGDKYGNDWRIVESVSKEERASGVKGTIIGSGKNMQQKGGEQRQQRQAPPPRPSPRSNWREGKPDGVPPQQTEDFEDPSDIPF